MLSVLTDNELACEAVRALSDSQARSGERVACPDVLLMPFRDSTPLFYHSLAEMATSHNLV